MLLHVDVRQRYRSTSLKTQSKTLWVINHNTRGYKGVDSYGKSQGIFPSFPIPMLLQTAAIRRTGFFCVASSISASDGSRSGLSPCEGIIYWRWGPITAHRRAAGIGRSGDAAHPEHWAPAAGSHPHRLCDHTATWLTHKGGLLTYVNGSGLNLSC